MRTKVLHSQPQPHQDEPNDNTARYVEEQVRRWRDTGLLVHPQVAMEIASWWASPGSSNPHMTRFGMDGTYEDGLLDEVWFELRLDRRGGLDEASVVALEALEAYVLGAQP